MVAVAVTAARVTVAMIMSSRAPLSCQQESRSGKEDKTSYKRKRHTDTDVSSDKCGDRSSSSSNNENQASAVRWSSRLVKRVKPPSYLEHEKKKCQSSANVNKSTHKLLASLAKPIPARASVGSIRGSQSCHHVGCNKQSIFNNEGERGGRFCATHKLLGMINVMQKLCKHDECNK
jgi:hypothetical protein